MRSIQRELTPAFEQRLRARLAGQDREWLIEQVVRLTLDAHSLLEMDRKDAQAHKERQRLERVARVRELALDAEKLRGFIRRKARISKKYRQTPVVDRRLTRNGIAPAPSVNRLKQFQKRLTKA